jgi:hypothetical protein
VKASRHSLVRLRQMSFDRTAADTACAFREVNRARESLHQKRNTADSIEDRRSSFANHLQTRHAARWFAQHWAFDRLLSEDLRQAREEVGRAQSHLNGRLEHLGEQKRRLAAARARLRAAQGLQKRRRRARSHRLKRRSEDEVSEIQTRCL